MTTAFEIQKDITLQGKLFHGQVLARCVISVYQYSKMITLYNFYRPSDEIAIPDAVENNVYQFEFPLSTTDEEVVKNSITNLYSKLCSLDVTNLMIRKLDMQ